jgi:hypothetical protein
MKSLAGFTCFFLLGGCMSQKSLYGQYFDMVRQSWHQAFGDGGVSREQAAAIPYASLGYRVNGGPELILVLATDSGGEQMWTAASHVVLVTENGRVKRSLGLPHDLSGTAPTGNSSTLPSPALALQGPFSSSMTLDFPDINAYSTPVMCRAIAVGRQNIQILGSSIATTRVDESCTATALNWRYRNSYWLDPQSGFVWRSQLHVHPKGGTLDIEILRPPG